MEPSIPFDDEGTRVLLLGDPQEVERAFFAINASLRLGICGRLKVEFPGLSSEALFDVWQETLLGILQAVRDGRFDPDRRLLPFVVAIARRKATDAVRRNTTQNDVRKGVKEALLKQFPGGSPFSLGEEQTVDLLEGIRTAIADLPPKQKIVMQSLVDNYDHQVEMRTLQEEVSDRTGRPETVASVKRALQEGRAKTKEALARQGFRI